MNMLITGDGKNWAKSKSIYEENPQEFCNQNWFSMFSLKLTRSLFHYRNGRRMQGNPVPASHSEKKYHEEHYEHYSKICQCSKEDLPTINNRTVKCKETYSNSNLGDVCQVSFIQVFFFFCIVNYYWLFHIFLSCPMKPISLETISCPC